MNVGLFILCVVILGLLWYCIVLAVLLAKQHAELVEEHRRLKKNFEGLLEAYNDLLSDRFPEIPDEKIAELADIGRSAFVKRKNEAFRKLADSMEDEKFKERLKKWHPEWWYSETE